VLRCCYYLQADGHEELGRLFQKQKDYRRAEAEFQVSQDVICSFEPCPVLLACAQTGGALAIRVAGSTSNTAPFLTPQAALRLAPGGPTPDLLSALGLCQVSQGDLQASQRCFFWMDPWTGSVLLGHASVLPSRHCVSPSSFCSLLLSSCRRASPPTNARCNSSPTPRTSGSTWAWR